MRIDGLGITRFVEIVTLEQAAAKLGVELSTLETAAAEPSFPAAEMPGLWRLDAIRRFCVQTALL